MCWSGMSLSYDTLFEQTYMPKRKTVEEFNYTFVECLLYTFHQLANKVRIIITFVTEERMCKNPFSKVCSFFRRPTQPTAYVDTRL
jgi:hypothetical protein